MGNIAPLKSFTGCASKNGQSSFFEIHEICKCTSSNASNNMSNFHRLRMKIVVEFEHQRFTKHNNFLEGYFDLKENRAHQKFFWGTAACETTTHNQHNVIPNGKNWSEVEMDRLVECEGAGSQIAILNSLFSTTFYHVLHFHSPM